MVFAVEAVAVVVAVVVVAVVVAVVCKFIVYMACFLFPRRCFLEKKVT